MENLPGLGASYAVKSKLEESTTLPIRPWKSITCAGTGANVHWPQQYRYVHGTIAWTHIPVFTDLGTKDLLNIGVYLKKI